MDGCLGILLPGLIPGAAASGLHGVTAAAKSSVVVVLFPQMTGCGGSAWLHGLGSEGNLFRLSLPSSFCFEVPWQNGVEKKLDMALCSCPVLAAAFAQFKAVQMSETSIRLV